MWATAVAMDLSPPVGVLLQASTISARPLKPYNEHTATLACSQHQMSKNSEPTLPALRFEASRLEQQAFEASRLEQQEFEASRLEQQALEVSRLEEWKL